jgi:hypothetical protein
VKTARLEAIAALRKEAAAIVQSAMPQTKQQLELCLWPALSKYTEELFDKMAEAKLNLGRNRRPKAYGRWLSSKCVPTVIDDVCTPIFGQFPITVRHVVEIIGENQSPEIESTRRALWGMLTEVMGGPFTENLKKRLNAHLEGRIPHWEGKAAVRRSPDEKVAPSAAVNQHALVNRTEGTAESDSFVQEGSTERRRPTSDKGNLNLLHGVDGKPKKAVTLDVASRFGGVTRRAIEKAIEKGSLAAVGTGPNRRIPVESILKYFPPENYAN